MLETWRWFGPDDPVTCSDIRQAGADGIVTALHAAVPGEVWKPEDIAARKAFIEAAGLQWSVVESIPVHPAIKLGDDRADQHIDGWIETMRNLAANGLEVICYNFMPVVDWTRTDLRHPARRGGLALRFDPVEFAVYDLLVLRRANADDTYPAEIIAKAEALYATMDEAAIDRLESTIIAGLPGSELSHGREGIRASIAEYDGLTAADLRANLITFLEKVAPAARNAGCGSAFIPMIRHSRSSACRGWSRPRPTMRPCSTRCHHWRTGLRCAPVRSARALTMM